LSVIRVQLKNSFIADVIIPVKKISKKQNKGADVLYIDLGVSLFPENRVWNQGLVLPLLNTNIIVIYTITVQSVWFQSEYAAHQPLYLLITIIIISIGVAPNE